MIKSHHLFNLLALTAIAGLYLHPTSRQILRAQLPLGAMDPVKPSFEIEITVGGKPYQDNDHKLRHGLMASLCPPELPAQILPSVIETKQHPSIRDHQLNHLLQLTKTEDQRFFVQLDPAKISCPEQVMKETRNHLKAVWENVRRAQIQTKDGIKPFRIRIL